MKWLDSRFQGTEYDYFELQSPQFHPYLKLYGCLALFTCIRAASVTRNFSCQSPRALFATGLQASTSSGKLLPCRAL